MTCPRPTCDFVVTSMRGDLGVARLLRAAGFAPVRRVVVMRRFYTLVFFLQEAGLTTRVVVESPGQVHEFCELCASDLTAEGLAFVRACHRPWLHRMTRDLGDERERGLLNGWLSQFRAWTASRVGRRG